MKNINITASNRNHNCNQNFQPLLHVATDHKKYFNSEKIQKFIKLVLASIISLTTILAFSLISTNANAQHVRGRVYFNVGDPFFPPFFQPFPFPRRTIIVREPPEEIVYVEKAPTVITTTQSAKLADQNLEVGYWYYCSTSKAYYPYVATCKIPWQKISPVPTQQ